MQVVHPVEGGVRRRLGTVVRVALHDAVGEAGREGGVGRDGGAVDGEAGASEGGGQGALPCREPVEGPFERLVAGHQEGRQRQGRVVHGQRARLDGLPRRFGRGEGRGGQQRVSGLDRRPAAQGLLHERVVRTQVPAPFVQPGGEQPPLQPCRQVGHPQQGLLQLRHPFGVGAFGPRRQVAVGRHRPPDRRRREAALQQPERAVLGRHGLLLRLDGLHLVEQAGIPGPQAGVGLDGLAELPLGVGTAGQDHRVIESVEAARVRLLAVRDREDGVADVDGLARLGVFFEEGTVGGQTAVEEAQGVGHQHIPEKFELGDRGVAARRAGVADDEDQVALLHPLPAPGEVVVGLEGFAVLVVDAEEGKVERVARVREVVPFPPEEAQLQLGGGHQAHVPVAAEDVGRMAPAVVEGDDLHLDVVPPVGPLQALGDGGKDLLAGGGPLGVGLGGLERGVDLVRHVFDGDELVGIVAGDGPFLRERGGDEAVVQQVLAGPTHLRDPPTHAVVVGDHQPVGGDERGRAAGDAEGAHPRPLEPGVVRVEIVRLGQVVERGILERPHLAVVVRPGLRRVGVGHRLGAGNVQGRRQEEQEDEQLAGEGHGLKDCKLKIED